MSKKLTKEEFINRSNIIHNNRYDYTLINYINNSTKIEIKCVKHGIFEQRPQDHLKGCGCSKCVGLKKLSTNDFIKKSNIIHNNKYDYSLVEYINSKIYIKIVCKKHGIFNQSPNSHLSGIGCSECATILNSNKLKYTNKEFITKSNIIHNNKYDYSLVEYINNKTKIKIICPIHGIFEQLPQDHLNSCGCSECNESKGEKIISKLLKEYNINFETQKTFEKCKNINLLKFDFYLPNHNICIEFDGEQHFKPYKHFGGKKGFINIQKRDNIKNEFCKNNNIKLIRIKHNENINLLNLINI